MITFFFVRKQWKLKFYVNSSSEEMVKQVLTKYNIEYRDDDGETSKTFIDKIATYAITRVRRKFMPLLIFRSEQKLKEDNKTKIKKRGGLSSLKFDKSLHVRVPKSMGKQPNVASNNYQGNEDIPTDDRFFLKTVSGEEDKVKRKGEMTVLKKIWEIFETGRSSITKDEFLAIALTENLNPKDFRTRKEESKENVFMTEDSGGVEYAMPSLSQIEMMGEIDMMKETEINECDRAPVNNITMEEEANDQQCMNKKMPASNIIQNETSKARGEEELNIGERTETVKSKTRRVMEKIFLDEDEGDSDTESEGEEEKMEKQKKRKEIEGGSDDSEDMKTDTQKKGKEKRRKKGRNETKEQEGEKSDDEDPYDGVKNCGKCELDKEDGWAHEETLYEKYGPGMKCNGKCGKTLFEVMKRDNDAWVCKKCADSECRVMFCAACKDESRFKDERRSRRKRNT